MDWTLHLQPFLSVSMRSLPTIALVVGVMLVASRRRRLGGFLLLTAGSMLVTILCFLFIGAPANEFTETYSLLPAGSAVVVFSADMIRRKLRPARNGDDTEEGD